MIMIKSKKARLEQLVDALRHGKDIPAPAHGWSGQDVLALAGAAFAVARSQGPKSFYLKGSNDTRGMHPEHGEAVEQMFDNDLHAAIGMYGELTTLVAFNEYDKHFAPEVAMMVGQTGTVEKNMVPVQGVKGHVDKI